jgi:bacillithiol biosynthesis cysteine-adding enzyme BshC
MTAISMAKEAKLKNPEYNFVPVFWMASEDHDFAEINHIQLGSHQFEWKLDATGPTGRLKVDSIESLITSLEHFLKERTYASELISTFKIAYKKGNSLAEATRILVDILFKNEGLVIVDADDIELKKSWAPIIEKELFQQKSFEACTTQTTALEKLNYPSQIFPREINLFYILDGFRERIIREGDYFKTINNQFQFTSEEIKIEILQHPERFSPNVVLRPVYQESILPNLCYIGGPGEIAYWLQLKTVFEKYTTPFPILAWRNNFMIVEQDDLSKWDQLGFSVHDFFKNIAQLENEFVGKHQTEKINLLDEELLLKNYIEQMKQKAIRVDDNLKYSLLGTEKRILRMMERIEHKIWKAEKRKYKSSLIQIADLKSKYFPNGKLQERTENFSLWYANCGISGMQMLLENTEPFAKHIKTITF